MGMKPSAMSDRQAWKARRSARCPWLKVALWLAPAAAWLFIKVVLQPVFPPYDDAFITFRYVRNVLEGAGAVYNSGEPVFGLSTLLYPAWLAVWAWFSPQHIPEIALFSNVVFAWVTGWLIAVWLLESKWYVVTATGAGLLFLVQPDIARWATGGMESFVFTAVVLSGFLLYRRGKETAAAVILGISVPVRPEGVIPAACVAAAEIYRVFRRRCRMRWGFFTGLTAPALLSAVMLKLAYGKWLPFSLIAKSRPLYPLPPGKTFREMVGMMNDWVLHPEYAMLGQLISPVAMVVLALGGAGVVLGVRRKRCGLWPSLWFVGLFGAYTMGNPLLGEWYHPLLYVPWLLAMMCGMRDAAAAIPVAAERRRRRLAEVMVLVLLGISTAQAWHRERPGSQYGWLKNAARRRVTAYEEAGRWLWESFPDRRVAAPEIGALGYYYRGYVLDACGLVTPEALPFIPVPADERLSPALGVISSGFVEAVRPDFVVTLRCFAERSLMVSEAFQRRYRLIRKIPLPEKVWRDSRYVLIYGLRIP